MLRLKLRGDTYYVVGQINGRRIRKTTKTSDKSIANEIRVQMEHEMLIKTVNNDAEDVQSGSGKLPEET